MAEYIIQDTTLEGIADAIRDMRHESGTLTPAQMEAKIRATRIGIPVDIDSHSNINPTTGKWVRPSQYPNLDSLTIGDDFDGVYLTYDLTKISRPFIGVIVNLNNSGNFLIDRGHIENGAFVVDDNIASLSRNSTYRHYLSSSDGNIQLFRITPADNNRHITRMAFVGSESDSSSTTNLANNYQPCVERVGRLDYVENLQSSPWAFTSSCYGTVWLERDGIKCKGLGTCTSLALAWTDCYRLQQLDVGDWDTSNWRITSMNRTFDKCLMLEELDIGNWDTSNWTMSGNAFYYTFDRCQLLKHIPIENWDTNNWGVITSLRGMFDYCRNLREVDLSNWDTSNWAITETYCMFMECQSLVKIDLSGWNTSNWAVTSMAYMFTNCISLRELNIDGWDVSNWRPTALTSLFNGCRSLPEIDLSDWDVSDWSPTQIESLFCYCHSAKHIITTGWNTSNWAVTTATSLFNECFSLEEIDLSHWDVSNWTLKSMNGFFRSCSSLKEIDLSDWDCSNFEVTNIGGLIGYCFALDTLILPITLDLSKVTSVSDTVRQDFYLQNINAMGIPIAISFSECYVLTPTSIINIINSLPQITSTKTITFGATNKNKVTAADIAVATQKGWTVA